VLRVPGATKSPTNGPLEEVEGGWAVVRKSRAPSASERNGCGLC